MEDPFHAAKKSPFFAYFLLAKQARSTRKGELREAAHASVRQGRTESSVLAPERGEDDGRALDENTAKKEKRTLNPREWLRTAARRFCGTSIDDWLGETQAADPLAYSFRARKVSGAVRVPRERDEVDIAVALSRAARARAVEDGEKCILFRVDAAKVPPGLRQRTMRGAGLCGRGLDESHSHVEAGLQTEHTIFASALDPPGPAELHRFTGIAGELEGITWDNLLLVNPADPCALHFRFYGLSPDKIPERIKLFCKEIAKLKLGASDASNARVSDEDEPQQETRVRGQVRSFLRDGETLAMRWDATDGSCRRRVFYFRLRCYGDPGRALYDMRFGHEAVAFNGRSFLFTFLARLAWETGVAVFDPAFAEPGARRAFSGEPGAYAPSDDGTDSWSGSGTGARDRLAASLSADCACSIDRALGLGFDVAVYGLSLPREPEESFQEAACRHARKGSIFLPLPDNGGGNYAENSPGPARQDSHGVNVSFRFALKPLAEIDGVSDCSRDERVKTARTLRDPRRRNYAGLVFEDCRVVSGRSGEAPASRGQLRGTHGTKILAAFCRRARYGEIQEIIGGANELFFCVPEPALYAYDCDVDVVLDSAETPRGMAGAMAKEDRFSFFARAARRLREHFEELLSDNPGSGVEKVPPGLFRAQQRNVVPDYCAAWIEERGGMESTIEAAKIRWHPSAEKNGKPTPVALVAPGSDATDVTGATGATANAVRLLAVSLAKVSEILGRLAENLSDVSSASAGKGFKDTFACERVPARWHLWEERPSSFFAARQQPIPSGTNLSARAKS